MKAAVKRLVAGPLRYAVRLVLQRPWLKKRVRDMVMRMPRMHKLVMRLMFQAPVVPQNRMAVDQKHLSPQARRVRRALKQAIRTHRR